MTQVESKLSPDDTAFIQAIGTETRGWLKVIEKLINIHVDGMTNTEEIILDLLKNADCLFQDVSDADHNTTATFLQLWKDIFNTETSKHSKKLLEKSIEIHDRISAEDFPAYLTGVSDRVRLIDHDTM
ncbi:metalloregulator ArsR/SmtB family transcription factor, partial [Aduncisulcus paluster]